MEFTTQLELQSQTTRLVENWSYIMIQKDRRGFHPPRHSIPGDFLLDQRLT